MDSAEPSGGTLLAPPVVLVAVVDIVAVLLAVVADVVFVVPLLVLAPFVVALPVVLVGPESPPESSLQPKAKPSSKPANNEACMTWSKRMGGAYGRTHPFSKQTTRLGNLVHGAWRGSGADLGSAQPPSSRHRCQLQLF